MSWWLVYFPTRVPRSAGYDSAAGVDDGVDGVKIRDAERANIGARRGCCPGQSGQVAFGFGFGACWCWCLLLHVQADSSLILPPRPPRRSHAAPASVSQQADRLMKTANWDAKRRESEYAQRLESERATMRREARPFC